MQACNRISAVCVPLYDSLGENAIEFIINHSESSIVFVSSDKMPALVKALPKTKDVLKTIVYWGPAPTHCVEASSLLWRGSVSLSTQDAALGDACDLSLFSDCQGPWLSSSVVR